MKKVLSVVLTVLMVLCILPTVSADEGDYTYIVENGEATIIKASATISGDVVIPAEIRGIPVTGIGDFAFSSRASITSVTIPKDVKSIGIYPFKECSNLEKIIVEDGNAYYYVKDNCLIEIQSKTLKVGFKNSIIPSDGSVTKIADGAFQACAGLTSIIIPEGVTIIGDQAFYKCTDLTSVTLPNSLIVIGGYAFYYCDKLTSVIIPANVIGVGEYAFFECAITDVVIPKNVENIGEYAFTVDNLESIVVEDENSAYHSENNCLIETRSKTLIFGCKNSVIPADGSVSNIGPNAFSGCKGLTKITIPKSVTTIGKQAFVGCSNLTSIVLHKTTTSIDGYAFLACSSVTDVWYFGTEEERKTTLSSYIFVTYNKWHYVKYGDVQVNGVLEPSDALVALQAVVGKIELDEGQKMAADVNGDGENTTNDALTILHFIVGKIDKFPVEQ